ncbi:MAG: hypothetical protein IAF58_10350 [Leptolyngbya sp.]|nr:hypothetical protein [Candidatus Melainabacteria bacterium]
MFLKPIHIVQGMVVTPWDFVGGWRHILRRWGRELGLTKPDQYLSRISIAGKTATWAKASDGHGLTCKFCHHAIAQISSVDGWEFQTCSAQNIEDILKDVHTTAWLSNLEETFSQARLTEPGDTQKLDATPVETHLIKSTLES